MHVRSTGCQWRYAPKDLPYDYFDLWTYDGTLENIHHTLYVKQLEIEVVKRSDQAKGFEVLPKRWVVERTFAWLNRCRRLAKDFENLTRNALAFLRLRFNPAYAQKAL